MSESQTLKGTVKSIKYVTKEPDDYGNTVVPLVHLEDGKLIGFKRRKDEKLTVVGANDKYITLNEGDVIESTVSVFTTEEGKTYYNGSSKNTKLLNSNTPSVKRTPGGPKSSKGQYFTSRSNDNNLREHGPAAGMGVNRAIDIMLATKVISTIDDFYNKKSELLQLALEISHLSNTAAKKLQSEAVSTKKTESDTFFDELKEDSHSNETEIPF